MGCVASKKIDKEERVQKCKERRRLMKQLLVLRSEFASAQMAYLQSLKNTGATLRQFTESESLEEEEILDILLPSSSSLDALPPPPPVSEPVPLPPPPPPLPFSPEENSEAEEEDEEGSLSIPLVSSSTWAFWDPFDGPSSAPSSPLRLKKPSKAVEVEEEEDWAETKTEFEEEEVKLKQKEDEKEEKKTVVGSDVLRSPFTAKPLVIVENIVDDSSVENSSHMTLVDNGGRRKKKSLAGLIRQIDDYFLKASDSGRGISLLLDINRADLLYQNYAESSMRKTFKSAKVFNALSWSWSSKSLHSNKDSVDFNEPIETCKAGIHCVTLEKIYAEEDRLYKEVKDEENTRLEYERKTLLLQKQEANVQDLLKTEEARSYIESLQLDIISLQQSISKTCMSILKLRDEELHPQLIELSSRLTHMWQTMYECHHIQNVMSQQLNQLSDHPRIEATTDYHRQSTAQLETEVSAWYSSFCNLLQCQQEYVRVLNRWVQLTDCLLEGREESDCLPSVHTLCEEWELALDRLPGKAVSEAIKSFVSVIHSIVLQQAEERTLEKKSVRLEKKLQKELNTLSEMEKKFDGNLNVEMVSSLSPNHPLAVKRAKMDSFKNRVEDEKAKYLSSVKVSHAMTLNNLKTSLPTVFQALTEFSTVCSTAFEVVNSHTRSTVSPGGE